MDDHKGNLMALHNTFPATQFPSMPTTQTAAFGDSVLGSMGLQMGFIMNTSLQGGQFPMQSAFNVAPIGGGALQPAIVQNGGLWNGMGNTAGFSPAAGLLSAPTSPKAAGPICKHYLAGKCNYGAACKFSHASKAAGAGVSPLGVYSGPGSLICKHWLSGRCTYPGCRFRHDMTPMTGSTQVPETGRYNPY
jgi:hypothetical protein